MKLTYTDDGPHGRVWRGKRERDGAEVFFVRVVAGISLPLDREDPRGALVTLGEVYDPSKSPTFEALAARVAPWAGLQRGLLALRRLVEFGVVVVEPGGEALVAVRPLLRDLRGAAPPSAPCSLAEAPPEVFGELTRQRVNELIREERLRLGRVAAILNESPEPSARAIQCAAGYCLRHPARLRSRDEREELREMNARRARSYSNPFHGRERGSGGEPGEPGFDHLSSLPYIGP